VLPRPRKPQSAASSAFTVVGLGNLLVQVARCCQPLPGEAIAGYLTRDPGWLDAGVPLTIGHLARVEEGAALRAGVLLRLRNRRYRRIAVTEQADADRDGIPDAFEP